MILSFTSNSLQRRVSRGGLANTASGRTAAGLRHSRGPFQVGAVFSRLNCNQSAFTLMELLVVCLLIAVMAALIVPEMRSSYEDALLRSTGRKLVDVFSLAYSRAVSVGEIHRVRLDKHSGQYLIERQVGDGQEDEDFEPASEIAAAKGQVDPRVFIDIQKMRPEGDDADLDITELQQPLSDDIFFYPDGTADGCEILLRDRMGFKLVLQISPSTARVQFVEPAAEGMTKSQ